MDSYWRIRENSSVGWIFEIEMDEFSILDSWVSFTVIGLARYPKIEFSKKWMKNCNFENNFGYWTELDWETDSCRTFLFQVSGWWIELCFRQSNVFHCTWKNKFEKIYPMKTQQVCGKSMNREVNKPRNQRTNLFEPVQIDEVPIRTEFKTKLGELVQRKARSFSFSQVFNFPLLQRSSAS